MGNAFAKHAPHEGTGLLGPPPSSYLIPPDPIVTGNVYVDQGTVCDPADPAHAQLWRHTIDAYCFMTPGQRVRQVSEYQNRLLAAGQSYYAAVGELKVGELLDKHADSAWFVELLLDVVGLAAIPAITKAVAKLRAGSLRAVVGAVDATESATLKTASGGEASSIVKQAVASAKRSVPRPSGPEDRNGHIAYLDLLATRAGGVFQHLREDALAGCTDIDLIVLTEAYDIANGHATADYKTRLQDLLRKFDDSGVGRLGVQWNDKSGPMHPSAPAKTDTKAFWVRLPQGRKLALYRAAHVPGTAAGEMDPVSWREVTAEEAAAGKNRWLGEPKFDFERYVADDFVDTALQLHEQAWGKPPTERSAGGAEWAAVGGYAP